MPHISKNKIEKEVLKSIIDRLIDILAKLDKKPDIAFFLNDLLTKTEKIMLAKRLAIAIMLHKNYPFGVISRSLKVSESTISAMRDRIDRGGKGYELVLNRLESDKSINDILYKINQFIKIFALPPVHGKRWKFLKDAG